VDILIRGAFVIDGTGRPGFTADVGIEGDTVILVGNGNGNARLEIDGAGLTAAPGFIDIHTHSDYSLLLDGRAMSAVLQGVSTQINGNCGISAFPVGPDGPYLGAFESDRLRNSLQPSWE